MDGPAAPWRVVDEPVGPGAANSERPVEAPAAGPPWRLIAGLTLAAALAAGAFAIAAAGPGGTIVVDSAGSADADRIGGAPAGSSSTPTASIVIDVQGAVLRPGVLRLDPGSRVGDAIAAAGGYGPRVDAERAAREINLAAVLADGDRILVPSRDDAAGPGPAGGSAAPGGAPAGDGLVDLNAATASELDELPGVGPVTAQKILDARAEQPFAAVDDLRTRGVVGQSVFEKLRDLVTVR